MKHKRIILVGQAASGKDHIRKTFEAQGFKYAVSYTTRPPRPDEIAGQDYFFIKQPDAQDMIDKCEFYNDDIFIMTPAGLNQLSEDDRKTSTVIYLEIDEAIRKQRLLERKMPGDSVERRLEADREDFKNFKNYNIKITNQNF